jgi:hypothetical protein
LSWFPDKSPSAYLGGGGFFTYTYLVFRFVFFVMNITELTIKIIGIIIAKKTMFKNTFNSKCTLFHIIEIPAKGEINVFSYKIAMVSYSSTVSKSCINVKEKNKPKIKIP